MHTALSNLAASLILALGCLYAAKEMHLILLSFVFRWPMELFDTTPTGRVMNRFSKDVDVVDNVLPQVLRSWIFMFFGVMISKAILMDTFFIRLLLLMQKRKHPYILILQTPRHSFFHIPDDPLTKLPIITWVSVYSLPDPFFIFSNIFSRYFLDRLNNKNFWCNASTKSTHKIRKYGLLVNYSFYMRNCFKTYSIMSSLPSDFQSSVSTN